MKHALRILLMVVSVASSAYSRSLWVQAGPIPGHADRLTIVVDGPDVSPLRQTFEIEKPLPMIEVQIDVPPIDECRIRGVAYKSGTAFPIILGAGKADHISPATQSTAYLALQPIGAEVMNMQETGSGAVSLTIQITDPAEVIESHDSVAFWLSSREPKTNGQGSMVPAPTNRTIVDRVLAVLMLDGAAIVPKCWQLAYYAKSFQTGFEVPTFFYPDRGMIGGQESVEASAATQVNAPVTKTVPSSHTTGGRQRSLREDDPSTQGTVVVSRDGRLVRTTLHRRGGQR